LRLDLTTDHGVQLLWKILDHPRVVAVHLGPPCGTSSRARDIRRHSGPDPKPLRDGSCPRMRCTSFQQRSSSGAHCMVYFAL
jgi:hypothetical protein